MRNFYEDLSWNFYTGTCLTLQEHCLEPAANTAEVNSVSSFCKETLLQLALLLKLEPLLSLFAQGYARGLWQNIRKAPISEG